jgi:para-aminobenzoate synthetase component 1
LFVSTVLDYEATTSGFRATTRVAPTAWPMWLKEANGWSLGVYPLWVLVQYKNELICYLRQADLSYISHRVNIAALSFLKENLLNTESPNYGALNGFSGGLMGWLSYPSSSHKPIDCASVLIGFYDSFIKADASCNNTMLYASNALISNTIKQYLNSTPPSAVFKLNSSFSHLMNKAQYQQAFAKVKGYLYSGDCYQVNLAQGFKASCTGMASVAFAKLLTLTNTPPYAAYAHTPYGEVLSLSPELFLAFDKDGSVLTRPIKGTRPRKTDPIADQAQFDDLASHPKDKAENLMIVDLLRNDLGKHAQIGTVTVPKLFSVESFAQVHHLISDIRCVLKADSHPLDLLFDAFPGGSITGAPKKRSMEIIAELENCDRAIYCGSIGYLNKAGDGVWNIAIRTLLRVQDELYAWAGGGIVADSECELEYEECFNKIGAMLALLEDEFLTN